ncbi:MAG: pyridoxal phosphate-dependent aminotransferase [Candidatus Omnitrophica bacterium]|nr:pyridoxal phosphate-dependent aminotransferase [Candidatus Omnitrophota bacterium]
MTTNFLPLASRVQKVAPSLTLAIEARAKQMREQGANVISFSAGEPDFDTPEFIKEKAIESLRKGFTKYTPASGILELRKAISEKLARENSLQYAPEDIVVSCGAKHAIYNVLQVLLEEGDEAVFSSPYWLSYPEMVTLASAKSVIVPTTLESGYRMTPEALEKAITNRTKLLILNSPANPTGAVYSKEELIQFAEICKKKSVFILSDEIYEHLIYDNLKHYSIGALAPGVKDLTITVNGASKSYAMTGWRLGFAACPKPIAKAIGSLQSHSTSNPTSFAQVGFLEAIKNGAPEVKKMRDAFEKRRNFMVELISKIKKIKCFKAQGAFYLFCDISDLKTPSLQFSDRLLDEAKVAVVPGVVFGDDHAIRLSFATSEKNIEEGIHRISDFINRL